MSDFDPTAYGESIARLIAEAPPTALGPGLPPRAAYDRLAALRPEQLRTDRPPADRTMAEACLAGLWLLYDYLDESHRISQQIDTPTGSFWHGIMHRREGDYGNAKYWFRRVGEHPIFPALAREARRLAGESPQPPQARFLAELAAWDAFRFVDLVQAVAGTGGEAEVLARQIARREWELLFDYCYRRC